MIKTFSEQEIAGFLEKNLKDWSFGNNTIRRDFKFKNFVDAFSFMTAVALEAEKLNHHPDWSNSYNSVTILITNHAAGGVTQLDFDLAAKTDKIFRKYLAG